ncbi:ABC transporter ATP-binding protein [Phytoactinopolyspora endophytica]|uniref:ABC transporter ATP-binding protein n=1 Tax=Phytoactinopolyspora endophytica TaxID=1642495 RepID=UPI00101C5292|nr:ABC transporter ATP-binding protein [Phytoactinopolyspora endophytica]
MRTLPYADTGVPDTRSPQRFLVWVARGQLAAIILATVYGVIWMVAQALMPWAIGQGVDEIAGGNTDTAVRWALLIGGLGIVQALVGIVRHRAAVANWIYAAFRTIQVVSRHTARTGPAVSTTMPTGEVVATSSSDAPHIGHAFEVISRFAGAIVSYAVVAVIVLTISMPLGLMVLIGVPVLVAASAPIIHPLQQRQREQREALGKLTALGADTVGGLRVLRGIGGEQVFLNRYAERSGTVRKAGNRLATTHSLLDGLMVLLPGIFLVLLTWVGARMVLSGTIEPGALVAMYGFAFFLVIPVRTAGEMAFVVARAIVAARRVLTLLSIERDVADGVVRRPDGERVMDADAGHVLADADSGLVIETGKLTMLVAEEPAHTARLADRLGRLVPEDGVTLDGTPLDSLPLSEVRHRVVVSDPEPTLFTGTLRSNLDPRGQHSDGELMEAMDVASGHDILETLRAGFDSVVEERGRSLSGGQRQRVALTRVLLADPEVLVLVEPTSAVDAHTEAAIAERLRVARQGRTTVVVTASPLMLAQADTVIWFDDGRIAASGTHQELLATTTDYRRTVIREEQLASTDPTQESR